MVASPPTLHVAVYTSEHDNSPEAAQIPWADWVEIVCGQFLETDCAPCKGKECRSKFGAAWSPVRFKDASCAGKKAGCDQHLARQHRLNDNVEAITAAVFDLDDLTEAGKQAILLRIDPFEYLIHSTHSHRIEDGHQRFRVILPISREISAADWGRFFAAAVAFLALPVDPTCKDLSRLYFLPSVVIGGPKWLVKHPGRLLDVDEILQAVTTPTALATTTPTTATTTTPPASLVTEITEIEPLRKMLAEQRSTYKRKGDDRHDLVDRILIGDPIARIGSRDSTINQAASILAVVFPPTTIVDAAIAILRPSIASMEVDPEGLDHWIEKARFSYSRAMERRIHNDAKKDAADKRLQQAMLEIARKKKLPETRAKEGEASAEDAEEDSAEIDRILDKDPDAWRALLRLRSKDDPADADVLMPISYNVGVILTYSPQWRRVLRWNEVTKEVEVHGGPLPKDETHSSILETAIANWISVEYDIHLDHHKIGPQILLAARKCAYDPIAKYLNEIVWDGASRIDNLFIRYLGARVKGAQGEDLTDHVRRIGRMWIMSAAARALHPGCQVDTVVTLEGDQGIRKSTFFRILGDQWFSDSMMDIGNKDSRQLACSAWIIELAELGVIKHSGLETLRSFITATRDKMRPPYGRAIETFLRRSVLVGTTNDDEYLSDPTGNRRWWPVFCEKLDVVALTADRDQLWAEAVCYVREHFAYLDRGVTPDEIPVAYRWHLVRDETAAAALVAEDRLITTSSVLSVIQRWWYENPNQRKQFIQIHDVATHALRLPIDRVDRSVETRVGNALKKLGFSRVRQTILGVRQWVYEASEDLLKAKVGSKGHGPGESLPVPSTPVPGALGAPGATSTPGALGAPGATILSLVKKP